jgi:AcrR family transcriptional regulator
MTVMADGYHHGHLRTALLDSAEELLQDAGAEGVTLREVARRAGVSHAAPYRHFDSKEDLLAEIARVGFDRLRERLAAVRGEDSVRAAGAAYVGFAVEQPARFDLMFGPYITDYERHPALGRSAAAAFEELVELIAAEQREGRIRGGPAEAHATFAWATVHGLATLLNSGRLGGADTDALIALATGSVLTGISSAIPAAAASRETPPGS